MAIRKRYGKHDRVIAEIVGDSMTKQSMKDEVDVNNIVARFRATGAVTHLAKGVPVFMDVSEAPDYRTALDHVNSVQRFFDGLAAPVRSEFGNDPAMFLDFVTDPENEDRVRELGLLPPKEVANGGAGAAGVVPGGGAGEAAGGSAGEPADADGA